MRSTSSQCVDIAGNANVHDDIDIDMSVYALTFGDHVRVLAHKQPADVRVEETSLRIVRIGVSVLGIDLWAEGEDGGDDDGDDHKTSATLSPATYRVLVMESMVSTPLVDVVLCWLDCQ